MEPIRSESDLADLPRQWNPSSSRYSLYRLILQIGSSDGPSYTENGWSECSAVLIEFSNTLKPLCRFKRWGLLALDRRPISRYEKGS